MILNWFHWWIQLVSDSYNVNDHCVTLTCSFAGEEEEDEGAGVANSTLIVAQSAPPTPARIQSAEIPTDKDCATPVASFTFPIRYSLFIIIVFFPFFKNFLLYFYCYLFIFSILYSILIIIYLFFQFSISFWLLFIYFFNFLFHFDYYSFIFFNFQFYFYYYLFIFSILIIILIIHIWFWLLFRLSILLLLLFKWLFILYY